MIAITAAKLFTPQQVIDDALLLAEGSSIVEIATRRARELPANCTAVDLGDAFLAPGYFDIHIHGGSGHDVMSPSSEALPAIERLLFAHGVTSYLPTTVTAPMDVTLAALERLAHAIDRAAQTNADQRARPVGIHLEGPFLSHARRGVHPPQNLLQPSVTVFDRLWEAARGHVKLMTIAPELEGASELIAAATKRGVTITMGHSDADTVATRRGITAGARHATHTFNAMRPLSHRDPGILGVVLSDDRLTADIIADGIHVDPAVVSLFVRCKGAERAVLITDATAATGMPEGHYRLGDFEFEVRDGKCLAGNTLAGSLLTMDQAVRNVMQFAGVDLQAALRMATVNPSKVVASTSSVGALVPGARADMVVLNCQGEVVRTIVGGQIL